MLRYMAKELAGVVVVTLFVTLFVFAMSAVSAPNAVVNTLMFAGILALLLLFIALMIWWEPLLHGGSLPIRVPSAVGIPIGVVAFVALFVSGLGELLLHVPEILSPAVALAVAATILGGASYLSLRPDPGARRSTVSTADVADTQTAVQS